MPVQRPMFIYAGYLPAAAVTATDTATGYAAANVLAATEDTSWKPANTTGSKSLVIDLSLPLTVNGGAIVGEYLNGVTVEVRGSTDNFATVDVPLFAATPIDQFIASWQAWPAGSYRQVKYIFSGLGESTEIYHVAVGNFPLMPFFEDGWDPNAYSVEGSHLKSVDGRHLASIQFASTYDLSINFGQLTSVEAVRLEQWADACINTMQAFFFVPDTGQTGCLFGAVDAKFKFALPSQSGVRKAPAIPYKARKP